MIKLINVSKAYNKNILFENVNLTIDKVGIYSFVGENGSGKTTLLNIISKFIKPKKGKVINEFKQCSFISQKVKLINHLKIKDHFKMFKIDLKVLKKVRLYKKIDAYPKDLSQGQRQRIACILAIYSKSPLLIADEPTSHLDKKSGFLIIKELVKASENKIVLLVSHDLELINKYSSQIYKIENKQLRLIENKDNNKNLIIQNNNKFKFKKYVRKSLKYYRKINVFFSLICFITFMLLLFSVNFKSNIENIIKESENSSLDYNKFYLKQCEEVKEEVTFKKCTNIDSDKRYILERYGHKVRNNYDLLLNSLYESSLFNVVSYNDFILKEGRYPLKYNEIITNDKYKIGDKITLKSLKVLNVDKTDIYTKDIKLEVVGTVSDSLINSREYYYLDYDLVEAFLKKEYLINNKKSLYEYFENLEINDYKYVLYFDDIELNLLKENNIDYLSSSYDYYLSLKEVIDEINKCLVYLNVIIVFFAIYYLVRLLKKKIESKENEILFLKSMGVNEKKIIKLINKEHKKIMLFAYTLSVIFLMFLFYKLFNKVAMNFYSFVVIFISLYINKKIIKRIIKKRISI